MFLIILILTLISPAIVPLIDAMTVHFILSPFTIVAHHSHIVCKLPFSVKAIIFEFTFIYISFSKLHETYWPFLSTLELTFIIRTTIVPYFFSLAVLLIVKECTLVDETSVTWLGEFSMALRIPVDESTLQYT